MSPRVNLYRGMAMHTLMKRPTIVSVVQHPPLEDSETYPTRPMSHTKGRQLPISGTLSLGSTRVSHPSLSHLHISHLPLPRRLRHHEPNVSHGSLFMLGRSMKRGGGSIYGSSVPPLRILFSVPRLCTKLDVRGPSAFVAAHLSRRLSLASRLDPLLSTWYEVTDSVFPIIVSVVGRMHDVLLCP